MKIGNSFSITKAQSFLGHKVHVTKERYNSNLYISDDNDSYSSVIPYENLGAHTLLQCLKTYKNSPSNYSITELDRKKYAIYITDPMEKVTPEISSQCAAIVWGEAPKFPALD